MAHEENSPINRSIVDIDEALSQNFIQLQRLANFYHQRGDYERAHELSEAVNVFRRQAEERQQRQALGPSLYADQKANKVEKDDTTDQSRQKAG